MGDAPADRLDTLLAGYPHRTAVGRMRGPGDHAQSIVASRYPIVQRLPDRPDGLSAAGAVVKDAHRADQRLRRASDPGPGPIQYQWGQITQVMALTERRLAAPANSVIAAGDFNSVSTARIGKQIQADMNLIPAPGWPGTWPSQAPAFAGITIDQVYRSPDLALITRRLGLPTGSDHRPVITEFTRAR